MIVRPHTDGELWLVAQHDHALLSGEMALAWRGLDGDEALSLDCVMATALHDVAWVRADDEIARDPALFDASRGLPHDFTTLPTRQKAPMYQRGIDIMERASPAIGLLGSLHFTKFTPVDSAPVFVAHERARRERLRDQLGVAEDDPVTARHLKLLRWFDLVSLFLCSTGPQVAGKVASWLLPPFTLEGETFTATWQDDHVAAMTPWPFTAGRIERRMPVRILDDAGPFDVPAAFAEAWSRGRDDHWRVRLVAG